MTVWAIVAVAVGGGIGAGVRWSIDQSLWTPRGFPWAIMLVNVTGCFAMALVHALVEPVAPFAAVAAAGFLGGYTTFSTVNADTVRLWSAGRRGSAIGNTVGTLAACIAAATLGYLVAGGPPAP
ncbi:MULTISPECIES: fluoride efflux transporter FluC [unclassified Microbacterium]|uniref:fluoride efflux transporter FluC n=1 Tax=unclassified Microbacterium TaxID=2609290 RepID=UPI00097F4F75|nr:CrcB family protein [Microbacterium sp. JB110]RCS60197.1 CrcB family protein [Microbacterium sp. JB110]SJM48267.1 CrcB protein [Frigoribacterium sp. JB110]